MKNIIKYILILFACLAAVTFFSGCGQDTPSPTVYKSPFSEVVDTRNTDIINKSNNAVEITFLANATDKPYPSSRSG